MDEVFGDDNFVSQIAFIKTSGQSSPTAKVNSIAGVYDLLLWYARDLARIKYRQPYFPKTDDNVAKQFRYYDEFGRVLPIVKSAMANAAEHKKKRLRPADATSATGAESIRFTVGMQGNLFFPPGTRGWSTHRDGFERLTKADRLFVVGKTLTYKRFLADYPVSPLQNMWSDTVQSGFAAPRTYVVQTAPRVVERCVLMTTDPGDLVLDPTCGSGTTAYVAEQWGRRWTTMDTSRVALALARSRIMGARYSYYTLADSLEGQREEARRSGSEPKSNATHGDIRHGFVYQRVPHVTLKAIANNTEIDAIWDQRQPAVEAALVALNDALRDHPTPFPVTRGARKRQTVDFTAPPETIGLPNGDPAPANGLLEWEVPRHAPEDWPTAAKTALAAFWDARTTRQQEIDASIAHKADFEYLYDKPLEDKSKVRVAGPFTVESLAPHRALAVDEQDELIPQAAEPRAPYGTGQFGDFTTMILENLRTAGVQQAHKADRIEFSSLTPWEGQYIAAEGRYSEGKRERRAGILIGPEFGTLARSNLVDAAREAADAGFDVVVSCAFAYDAQATDLHRLGKVPILKARMNADLHMAEELKTTGKGNLFVVFGEPDIEIEPADEGQIQVRLHGVDVFHPQTGEVRSDSAAGIACWMLDTEYDGESFFVRHAYFPGAASDPYKALKTTLKAEIDHEAWESLRRTVSRPFRKPTSGRIAVKVINHLGDEVMKVFRV